MLGGSLLFDRPEHRAAQERISAFIEQPRPLALEIGFDHGAPLLDRAERFPEVNWLGLEIRKREVDALRERAPANLHVERTDARIVLAALMPDARLSYVYALFPTPATNPRHLLFTRSFVEVLARVLAPGGSLYIKTDVPAMGAWIEGLLAEWPEGLIPPLGVVPSRRERVCARDGLPVTTICRRR